VHTLQKAQREQRKEAQQRAASQARTSQLAKLRTRQQAAPNFTLNALPEAEEDEDEDEDEDEVATPGSPPAPRRSSRTPLPVTRYKASPAPPPTKLRRAMQETSAVFGLPSEL
tara:strand:- start:277 stop:615 length:339 start_codon:yes stop_codon:yes gene_type:complete